MDSDSSVIGFSDMQVNEWCAIEQSLIEDIDASRLIFNEMRTLSKNQLGPIDDKTVPDARAFFDRLENHFSDESDKLEFLVNLTSYMKYHINFGSQKVADLVKNHKKKLEKIREKCEHEEGLFRDKYFIGRQEYIRYIQQKLTKGEVTGFCICGLGGMGKTSVAREVCVSLWKNKNRWIPKNIDLREVRTIKDLLRDTLAKLGEFHMRETTDELTQQLFNIIKNDITTQTILLFDNIDDVMERERDSVIRFLLELVGVLETYSKVKVLVTYRQSLVPPEDTKHQQQIMSEIELKPLSEQDSVALLNKYTSRVDISPGQAQQIVRLCGCTPLVIRTLGSGLKSRLITADKVIQNLRYGFQKTCLTETLNIRHCIQQTFDTMDSSLQNELMKISVFRTAPFDITSASAILNTEADMTSLYLLCFKSRHFVEVDTNYNRLFCGFTETKNSFMYSLHPIVFAFLSEHLRKEDTHFQNIYSEAKVRFAKHFYNIAVKAGKEKDTNFGGFQKIIEKHRSHLSIFFDISDIESDVIGRQGTNTKANKRLYDTLCFIKDDGEIQKYANKMANNAFSNGDTLRGTYWKVLEGLSFIEDEKIDEAWDVVDNIEENDHSLQFDDAISRAAICGEFNYLKGRLFIHKNMYEDAIECLEQAVNLYSAHNVKNQFSIELAKVHNSIGTVYFKGHQCDYHNAKTQQMKALQLAQGFCKDSHPDIANYMANIAACLFQDAMALKRMGQPDKETLNQALEYYNMSLGLDISLNRHKTQVKDYAMKLMMRANCRQALGYYDEALEDYKLAFEKRQHVFKEPNDMLTISTHRIGNTLRLKAIKEYKCGRDALGLFEEAVKYYDKAMEMIAEGGLSTYHDDDYNRIRDEHQKLAKHVHDQNKQRTIEVFYLDYQRGKYKKAAAQNRERKSCDQVDFPLSTDDSSSCRSSSSSSASYPTDVDEEPQSENEMSENELNISTNTFASGQNDHSENITEYRIGNVSENVSSFENGNDSAISLTDQAPAIERCHNHIQELEKNSFNKSNPDYISQDLKHSLSYQSSLEEDVFSKPDQSGNQNQKREIRYSSGYSSGYESSVSLSLESPSTSKSTIYSPHQPPPNSQSIDLFIPSSKLKRSAAVPVFGNQTGREGKRIKRSSSQTTHMESFMDKILNKKPKLSRKLLGSSFDEDEEL